MNILRLMLDLAPHKTEILDSLWRATHPFTQTEITTIWNPAKQPEGSPRYTITKGDVIACLAYIPTQCIKDGKFTEMDITIRMNSVIVARGVLRAKQLRGILDQPVNGNATTA